MHINNLAVRYVGQRYGANYAPPHPGEHVVAYLNLEHAAEQLRDDMMACEGDTIILWRCSPHDSDGEAMSRTLSEAAHADYLLTLGPFGGVKRERIA